MLFCMVGKLTLLGGNKSYVAIIYLQIKLFLLPNHLNCSISLDNKIGYVTN